MGVTNRMQARIETVSSKELPHQPASSKEMPHQPSEIDRLQKDLRSLQEQILPLSGFIKASIMKLETGVDALYDVKNRTQKQLEGVESQLNEVANKTQKQFDDVQSQMHDVTNRTQKQIDGVQSLLRDSRTGRKSR